VWRWLRPAGEGDGVERAADGLEGEVVDRVQRRLRPRGGGGHEQDEEPQRSQVFADEAGRRGFCRSPPSLAGFPAKAHLRNSGCRRCPLG
jgi:hypothetical protein